MSTPTSTLTGCGSSSCQCAGPDAPSQAAMPTPAVNGIELHPPGQRPDIATLRELAYAELLRQQAVVR
ncbi:MAG: peptidylprolyl isomerase, partial [Rhodoferax sp.]|nr:peptidylprolyl isomerase [Rhodoferax sp.]